jgi:hypothetical protein
MRSQAVHDWMMKIGEIRIAEAAWLEDRAVDARVRRGAQGGYQPDQVVIACKPVPGCLAGIHDVRARPPDDGSARMPSGRRSPAADNIVRY